MQVPHDLGRQTTVGTATRIQERMSTIRTILFICSPGTISGAMTAAIEREFSWLSVTAVHDIRLAMVDFEHPVQLVLADAASAPALNTHWGQFSSFHRQARLALICNDIKDAAPCYRHTYDFARIEGVVPFNVNLDVFLSALRILLKGGQYFPSSGRNPEEIPAPFHDVHRESRAALATMSEAPAESIRRLTKRENEILARMAMGNQNKIIAATLGLSEHTVKIHIHNIITKLGVHNRTEVVARYFEHSRKDRPDHARQPDYTGHDGSFSRDQE